ncbi:hypothetical protein, partial [Limnospira platensis]|uniref:hypothetical protein n=1 Tax=Limnospira platensis TaxID=118562 RepID=UPI0005517664
WGDKFESQNIVKNCYDFVENPSQIVDEIIGVVVSSNKSHSRGYYALIQKQRLQPAFYRPKIYSLTKILNLRFTSFWVKSEGLF